MKMTIYFRKWFMLACAGIVSLSFTGCDDKNKEQNYLYTIGIEDYQYSSVGSGIDLFGPLTYLESLKIPSNLSVTSTSREDADAQAVARFDTEMAKIDADRLNTYSHYYFRYVLTSVERQQTIAQKEFGTK